MRAGYPWKPLSVNHIMAVVWSNWFNVETDLLMWEEMSSRSGAGEPGNEARCSAHHCWLKSCVVAIVLKNFIECSGANNVWCLFWFHFVAKKISLLKHGRIDIVQCLRDLPKTRHHPGAFSVDVIRATVSSVWHTSLCGIQVCLSCREVDFFLST